MKMVKTSPILGITNDMPLYRLDIKTKLIQQLRKIMKIQFSYAKAQYVVIMINLLGLRPYKNNSSITLGHIFDDNDYMSRQC